MRRFIVPKSESGFTATELLIAIVMVGIMAAISAPSFMAMLNRAKVNNAVTSIQGALKEAQREAMRKSQQCSITLEADGVVAEDEDGTANACLPTGDRTVEDGIVINSNRNTLSYGIRGNLGIDPSSTVGGVSGVPSLGGAPTTPTITVYYESNGNVQGDAKCIVISEPLGIVRTGVYDDNSDPTATPAEANCN